MTNFEWLMTLSEEEFTDWVYDQWLHHLQYRWSSSRGGLMIWLKEERAEQTEPQTNRIADKKPTPIRDFMVNGKVKDEPQTDCVWK
ncbi:MAG: hypothetical protein IIY21_21520 [Clostridiales bacterium]|nr:hypothetical protein [Clostridiales bacterium]